MNTDLQDYFLGLGSNLGDRANYLTEAIHAISRLPETQVLAASPAYDSDPVGYTNQGNFLNLCLWITCRFDPPELLAHTLAIETRLGRVRHNVRNGPRTIDIDLLFWAGGTWSSPELTLPHPRWFSRGFVVKPLGNLLHIPKLAKSREWTWLSEEVASIQIEGQGLRIWNGPTPWINLL